MDTLAKHNDVKTALLEARTVGEVKRILDIAKGAFEYAKSAKEGADKTLYIAEAIVRAERRLGEVLRGSERSEGGRPTKKPVEGNDRFSSAAPTYTELGITRDLASRAQRLADVDEAAFEQALADARTAGVPASARKIADLTRKAGVSDAEFQEEPQAGSPTNGEKQDGAWTRDGVLGEAGPPEKSEEVKPHVSYNSGVNEWYTPPEIIEAARDVMGRIDLDPASTKAANEVVQATHFYTIDDDGLTETWRGRIWLNPPYAQPLIQMFIQKLIEHLETRNVIEAITLTNNATETRWGQALLGQAAAACFLSGRVRFYGPGGEVAAPLQGQVACYFGDNPSTFCRCFSDIGALLWGG